jgi:hypothetical protein
VSKRRNLKKEKAKRNQLYARQFRNRFANNSSQNHRKTGSGQSTAKEE